MTPIIPRAPKAGQRRGRLTLDLRVELPLRSYGPGAPTRPATAPGQEVVMPRPVMKGFARLNDLPEEKVGEKITRRILVCEQEMVVSWKMKAGAHATRHQHPHLPRAMSAAGRPAVTGRLPGAPS
jgi:hypothetical protein